MRTVFCTLIVALGLLFGVEAFAADTTPVGTWTQVDDATGKPKSLIEITQQSDGTLQAVVRLVYFSDQGTNNPVCDKCEGERHDQPVVGMTVMWGVKQDGDQWDGGQILDPGNGKTYKVRLRLADGGQKLDVRGYIGTPLLGRTQTWLRKPD